MKKILLIEDDPRINQNIKEALTASDFEVIAVLDGLLGEKLLKKNNFDCVILDINLPNKNGYDLCKEFRNYNTVTPVLILTAFDEIDDKVLGYESGADDYLTKPFYMKELVLRVQSLLKRNKSLDSPEGKTIIAGDIVIDTVRKRVTRKSEEIALTPREYQILLKLIVSKGGLVTKKELIEEIWGSSFDANTNTIEVYINFLRKKIDRPFGKDSIKTKVGFGYYFVTE